MLRWSLFQIGKKDFYMKAILCNVFKSASTIMLTKVISKSSCKVLQREENTITSKGLVFFSQAVQYSAFFNV